MVKSQLQSEVDNMNFVTANGLQFAHPLQHLGKSKGTIEINGFDEYSIPPIGYYLLSLYFDGRTTSIIFANYIIYYVCI